LQYKVHLIPTSFVVYYDASCRFSLKLQSLFIPPFLIIEDFVSLVFNCFYFIFSLKKFALVFKERHRYVRAVRDMHLASRWRIYANI
jgi:hypothetical protein